MTCDVWKRRIDYVKEDIICFKSESLKQLLIDTDVKKPRYFELENIRFRIHKNGECNLFFSYKINGNRLSFKIGSLSKLSLEEAFIMKDRALKFFEKLPPKEWEYFI